MGKNGKKAGNGTQTSAAEKIPDVSAASGANDTGVSQKLDTLLEAVKNMGDQLRQQDERLRRQEEKTSIHDLSAVPSAQSSPKHSKQEPMVTKPDKLPSFEVLRSDSKIQAEVAKRLNDYQNVSRGEIGKPTSSLKSGRFRAGVAKVKSHVNWPQDFCVIQIGSKQPTYDELTNEQWVQGFLYCVLEEKDNDIRDNMLQYYALLMQDAIELNIQTAKRAHAAVLQEIERGRADWQQLEVLEKIKNRYTQRLVQNQKVSGTTGNTQACVHFNKGFCRLDNDHVSGGVLYQHCCSYCLKETGKKFDHPLTKCLRNKSSQGVNKSDNASSNKKEQKV